jgi:hypothetical protein
MTPFGSRIPLTFRAATAVSHYDFVCLGMRLLLNPPDRPGSLRLGLAGGLSDFLGDPPPDPRFLASLGALSWVDVHHCCVVGLFGVFWTGPKGCWWVIGFPGDPPSDGSLGSAESLQRWIGKWDRVGKWIVTQFWPVI